MATIADPVPEAPDLSDALRSWARRPNAVFSPEEAEAVLEAAPTQEVALDWAYRRALGMPEDVLGLGIARPRSRERGNLGSR